VAVYTEEFYVSTSSRFELVDITDKVVEAVRRSGIKNGIVQVFVPHATAAVIANEHERGLINDYITLIKRLFPPDAPWEHNRIDDNAHAHLAAGIIGPSRSFPLVNGSLVRGTWQNIFLVELDGPRSRRRVVVTVVGE
jgi:secondary thiamine-phosphate synthase enzyme